MSNDSDQEKAPWWSPIFKSEDDAQRYWDLYVMRPVSRWNQKPTLEELDRLKKDIRLCYVCGQSVLSSYARDPAMVEEYIKWPDWPVYTYLWVLHPCSQLPKVVSD